MKNSICVETKTLANLIFRRIVKKDITPIQANIIEFMYQNRNSEIYQRDLEGFLNCRRSTISGLIDTMEKNNLIIRLNSSKDDRLKELKLTDKAIERIKLVRSEMEEFEKKLKKGISEDELNTFFNVIDKIKENLND